MNLNEKYNGTNPAGTREDLGKTITNKIDEIIKNRKDSLLPEIRNKIKQISGAVEQVDRLNRLKNDILNGNGELIESSKYYKLFYENPEMAVNLYTVSTDTFTAKANELLEKYRELELRFDKDYINISVVGEAGSGKSRLLQSLTGLDNRCIPSFSGDHCTGASSTIENSIDTGDGVEVTLTFKNEYELLEEINEYVNEISDPDNRIMSLNGIEAYYNKVSELDRDDVDKNSLKSNFKERYVDNYREWSSYIGSEPMTLTDENVIMTFVAQNNGKREKGKEQPDYKKFYKYIAVKQARIKKKFNYDDAGKIRFIDTVGLGDTALGDEKKMYTVIGDKSDSIIFFIRPRLERGAKLSKGETHMLGRVTEKFKKRNIEKWMSILINKIDGDETQNNYCEGIKKQIDDIATQNSFMRVIVNAADEDEVREKYLVPMLNEITKNLPMIDDMRVGDLKEDAESVYDSYVAICRVVSGIIKGSVSGSPQGVPLINKLIRETYNGRLTPALRKMNKEMGENKNEICYDLKKNVKNIVDNMMENFVPEVSKLEDYLRKDGTLVVNQVYSHFLDVIRSDITSRFIEIDASIDYLINDFKNKITNILIEDGMLGKIVPRPDSGETFEWLKDFRESQLTAGNYKQLPIAFDFLYSFTFTVRGSMMNKVRSALYPISTANPNQLSNVDFSGGNSLEAAQFHLKLAVKDIKDYLELIMDSFYISPNEAMFAVSDEFFDRITRSENVVEEWETLYSANAGNIWYKDIANSVQAANSLKEWTDCIEELNKYNKRGSFIMSVK